MRSRMVPWFINTETSNNSVGIEICAKITELQESFKKGEAWVKLGTVPTKVYGTTLC